MKRSLYAVVLVMTLVASVTMVAAQGTAVGEPMAKAPGPPTTGDSQAIDPPTGPRAEAPLCPGDTTAETGANPGLPWDVQPEVGAPCCTTLCEQVCGVGEACLCKRCEVLGCGV